jgi:hypothetical protein
MQREETVTGLIHPESIGNRTVWSQAGSSPGDLADKLRFGDPTRGWEGDERLALCLNDVDTLWEVWRLDHSSYHLVARRSADQPLDDRVIDLIMSRDTRRHPDALEKLYKHNEAIDKAKEQKSLETMLEATERTRFEIRKAGLL